MYKVSVYAPAERADTLPLFHLCVCGLFTTGTSGLVVIKKNLTVAMSRAGSIE
jgi:hypothetical protein